jgi:hypothetical protein
VRSVRAASFVLLGLVLVACTGAGRGERHLDFRAEVHLPAGVASLEVDGQPVAAADGAVVIERTYAAGAPRPALVLRLDQPALRAEVQPDACRAMCRQLRPPGGNCNADFDREHVVLSIGADGVLKTVGYGCSSPGHGAFDVKTNG